MQRKTMLALLIVLLFVLLAGLVLAACETAGQPQPTATPKASTPKPTEDTGPVEKPTPDPDYPPPAIDVYPTP